jgi:FAD/FMN-containing dehydrogenase
VAALGSRPSPAAHTHFQCSIDNPPGLRNYWTAEHLAELPDDAIDAIVQHAWELPAGESGLVIICWGGAVARSTGQDTPLGGRDARWIVHPLLLWEDPADDRANLAHGRAYREVLLPWSTGAAYLNFIGDEGAARVRAGFRPDGYDRLEEVKAAWDPDNVFSSNQNIVPA